ncbi:MAG: hypothetical protein GY849_01710, partial [Deltaproteobacteria bacterium]|nr:hypothetical protein [Deltaproteobacteria bacterium]
EALSVYAPLEPDSISTEKQSELPDVVLDEETLAMVPLSPLYHTRKGTLLTGTLSGIKDPLLVDRLRLEFAGLCNQIISADGMKARDMEALIKTCRKTGAYLNLALEKLCGPDVASAENLLKNHALLTLFRVGFGLAMKLKWKAERWLKESWFYGKEGFVFSFWGDAWGETLAALMEKRPRLWVGLGEEETRDFERLSELEACRNVLERLMVLDRLLARLTGRYVLDKKDYEEPGQTFHPLLFNLWARGMLELPLRFSGIGRDHEKQFFGLLRDGESSPPFRMPGFEAVFVRYFLGYVSDFEPEARGILKETLTLIWDEFRDEYAWVPADNLDGRFSGYMGITS